VTRASAWTTNNTNPDWFTQVYSHVPHQTRGHKTTNETQNNSNKNNCNVNKIVTMLVLLTIVLVNVKSKL